MSAPSSFRLDTLTVHLVGRLEATRRAHLDAPDAAREAFARVTQEAAGALARECRELGDDSQAALLEREAIETFLPRYTRMALAQNSVEAAGYGGILGDGIVARVVATGLAVALAFAVSRFLPGTLKEVPLVLAVFTPILPELRLWWTRRAWTRALQELADDLGRVQDAAEELPAAAPTADPIPVPPQPARTREEAR